MKFSNSFFYSESESESLSISEPKKFKPKNIKSAMEKFGKFLETEQNKFIE